MSHSRSGGIGGRGRGSLASRQRAQTLPDFVVGIAIFLVTVTFVLQFVPQLVLPYGAQEGPVVAQRASSRLSDALLAVDGQPSALNGTCTLVFFERTAGAGCPFDPTESVTAQLGIGRTYVVNVTLRDAPSDAPGSSILCDAGGTIGDCAPGDVRLRIGPPVPTGDRAVAIARRHVYVGDAGAVIEVGVW